MWQKIRWVFPVIFAGIVMFKIYGHFSVHKPPPLPTTLADPFSEEPYAAGHSRVVFEPVDPEEADEPEEAEEAPEPPRNHLPVVLLATAVGLTAGYFGFRRVWAR
jgi:hypothetical protein